MVDKTPEEMVKEKIANSVITVANDENVPNVQQSAVKPITDAVSKELVPIIMNATNNEPWYQSRVTWGAILAGVSGILAVAGFTDILPEEQQGRIVNGLVAAGPLISMLIVLYGRYIAKKPIGQ